MMRSSGTSSITYGTCRVPDPHIGPRIMAIWDTNLRTALPTPWTVKIIIIIILSVKSDLHVVWKQFSVEREADITDGRNTRQVQQDSNSKVGQVGSVRHSKPGQSDSQPGESDHHQDEPGGDENSVADPPAGDVEDGEDYDELHPRQEVEDGVGLVSVGEIFLHYWRD